MQTQGLYTIHFRLQDQEGHPEHISNLGTLSSPNSYYFIAFSISIFVMSFSTLFQLYFDLNLSSVPYLYLFLNLFIINEFVCFR